MSDFLDKIKMVKIIENSRRMPAPLPFIELFDGKSPRIIAEVKNASPSLGQIANHDPVDTAKGYLENGASAVSVLTECEYFAGKPQYVRDVRANIPTAPILQKDFFIDKEQICEARSLGASAILLIVAMLSEDKLKELYDFACSLGLTALVEVHSEPEMEVALKIGAKLIGVNNRNLQNMQISLDVSRYLAKYADKATLICESGIKTYAEVKELFALGYKGFLIGTSFMHTSNPPYALKEFLEQ